MLYQCNVGSCCHPGMENCHQLGSVASVFTEPGFIASKKHIVIITPIISRDIYVSNGCLETQGNAVLRSEHWEIIFL